MNTRRTAVLRAECDGEELRGNGNSMRLGRHRSALTWAAMVAVVGSAVGVRDACVFASEADKAEDTATKEPHWSDAVKDI